MEAEIIEYYQKIEYQENIDTGLQLCRIIPTQEYSKEWNLQHYTDFCVLSKNGKLLRNQLYRIGCLNSVDLAKDKYFMLLKYSECIHTNEYIQEYYPGLTKEEQEKKRKTLSYVCVILDKEGNEKIVFNENDNVFLCKNSCIYSSKGNYFNIDNGYCYGYGNVVESDEFLFLENNYDQDISKRGVLKINKQDGSYELFPNTSWLL